MQEKVKEKPRRHEFSIMQKSYVRPKITEVKAAGGYMSYGDDNKYPDYLLNIYFGSSQHQGIIQRKVDEILGNGLVCKNKAVSAFIEKCNNKGQTLDNVLRKCVNDNEIIGGFALQIIYGAGSTAENPIIAELYYIDIAKLRWNTAYTKLLYSKEWSKGGNIKTMKYDAYNPEDPTGTKIYYYSGTMTREWYPIPQYVGSIPAIETAIDIANFNKNTIANGFFPSLAVTFYDGQPTEEEKAYNGRALESKWGGTDNSGRIMVSYADEGGKGPTIEPIAQPDLDKRFAELKTSVIEDIFIGHRITDPTLFGLAVAGKLGGSRDYNQSYAIFQNVYVKPQRRILFEIFNDILTPIAKGDPELEIKAIEPINNVFSDEALIASQMTQEEIRKKIFLMGYIDTVEIPKGQQVIIEQDQPPLPDGAPAPELKIRPPTAKL